MLSEDGAVEIEVPRDRNGSFEPQIVPKGETRLDGFDDKIISLYARGMTVREIQGHLRELYAVEVSPDLISRVTDAVLDEVREWQNRPLDAVYPVVFFDALRVKIRDESVVKNKAVYIALALDCEGHKHVLGIWIEQSEGAKFWLRVMNELKNRGVEDVVFAVVDGLKGFPDAITTVFPQAIVQTCIVHLTRHSLNFVSWKDRKPIVPALRAIYRAETSPAQSWAMPLAPTLIVGTETRFHARQLDIGLAFTATSRPQEQTLPDRFRRYSSSGRFPRDLYSAISISTTATPSANVSIGARLARNASTMCRFPAV